MKFLSDEELNNLQDNELKDYFKEVESMVKDYIKKMVYEIPFNNNNFLEYKKHSDKVWNLLKERNYFEE